MYDIEEKLQSTDWVGENLKGKLIFITLLAMMLLSVSGVCAGNADASDVLKTDVEIQSGEGQIINGDEEIHETDGGRTLNVIRQLPP